MSGYDEEFEVDEENTRCFNCGEDLGDDLTRCKHCGYPDAEGPQGIAGFLSQRSA